MFNFSCNIIVHTFYLESSVPTSNLIGTKKSKTFAMTVSLYLHVFSHRQLYIAFASRVDSGWVTQKLGVTCIWVTFDRSSGLICKLCYIDVTWILIDHMPISFLFSYNYIIGCAFCTGLTIRYIWSFSCQ